MQTSDSVISSFKLQGIDLGQLGVLENANCSLLS